MVQWHSLTILILIIVIMIQDHQDHHENPHRVPTLVMLGGDHDDHGDEDQHHAQDENADDHHVPMFAVELRPC